MEEEAPIANDNRTSYIEEIQIRDGRITVQGYQGDPMQVAWMLEQLNRHPVNESGRVRHLVAGLLMGVGLTLVVSVALGVQPISPLVNLPSSQVVTK